MVRGGFQLQGRLIAACALFFAFAVSPAHADNAGNERRAMLKNRIGVLGMYKKGYASEFFPGTVEQLENEEAAAREQKKPASEFAAKAPGAEKHSEKPAEGAAPAEKAADEAARPTGPTFVENFKPEHALPPDVDPPVRVNPDAPAPFILMKKAMDDGDLDTAKKYAGTFVRYQQNFFFEVRAITEMIGRALIEQKEIDDDDWDGVPQYLDHEFALARKETNALFAPKHDVAMKRIKADERNEAEVYYFFHMNCSPCRQMAPDVERLFQAVRFDRNVKIVGLTVGPTPKEFLKEYRNFTGLTMPVFAGEELAKNFGVKFTPALVVVAPNGKRAYLKTGQQSFDRMYDFVRHVQGLPSNLTPALKRIREMQIGELEKSKFNPGKNLSVWLGNDEERKKVESKLSKPLMVKASVSAAAPKQSSSATGGKKKASLEKF